MDGVLPEDLNTESSLLTTDDLTLLHLKLDEILEFQRELRPFIPLLAKAAAFLDNPASRFKDTVTWRRRSKDDKP